MAIPLGAIGRCIPQAAQVRWRPPYSFSLTPSSLVFGGYSVRETKEIGIAIALKAERRVLPPVPEFWELLPPMGPWFAISLTKEALCK
jgi:hypothetical protein